MKRTSKRQKKQPGRNDSCPCGSGRKYKHCCLAKHEAMPRYSREDRETALPKLTRYTEELLGREDDEAWAEFWDDVPELEGRTNAEYIEQVGEQAFDWWFWFDRPVADGSLVVDALLAGALPLGEGERRYLELARESCLRLYEVVQTVPGKSVTLRNIVEGGQVTVTERLASRELVRGTVVATRVLPGEGDIPAVMDGGVMGFPALAGRSLVEQTLVFRDEFLAEEPRAPLVTFFKTLAPGLYLAWVQQMLEPILPLLCNTDGEETVWTTIHFDVTDPGGLGRALDAKPELDRDEEAGVWRWHGTNAKGGEILLGSLELREGALLVETNSKERGARIRALVESVAGGAVAYRTTTHKDMRAEVMRGLRSGGTPGFGSGTGPTPMPMPGRRPRRGTPVASPAIPAEIQEELVLGHLGRHYHRWVDEPVPALRDRSPRDAARDPGLRGEVEKLVRGLEGMYERALRSGEPAYDPSWMWPELGLADPEPAAHPPPLAHDRWDESLPGFADACGKATWALRARPGLDEGTFVATPEDLGGDLDLRRLCARKEAPPDLLARLRYGVSFELHRRKVFWVDEALAFMLSQTDLDVDGALLRVPFPAFALVFTDRHTLSLAERLLASDEDCPIRGHLLRCATVYVLEEPDGADRVIHLGFALDTRGEDPPHLVEHRIRAAAGERVVVNTATQAEVQGVTPGEEKGPRPVLPLPGLLRITLNAILYASSPASEKVPRPSPTAARRTGPATGDAVFTSDDVFYLPGQIPISQVRQLQRLDHLRSGRQLMTRFMVRGHWRSPAKSWADQRMRWIQPYWKGPDLAAIIERTYRLEP